ncbi:MAG: major outer membrane protein, partial [Pseudomonadales bacterium]|nr:major outer membrane protein [Pseudomonadales bacterium]
MPTTKKTSLKLSVLAAAMSPLLGLGLSQTAIAADSIADALKEGDTVISLRLRYENVDADDKNSATPDGSDAITLKTRLTYTSGDFNGLGMTLELDDVTSLKSVNYKDGVNSGENGPAIVDPEDTGVNQVYLSYKVADTTIKYGRQRI